MTKNCRMCNKIIKHHGKSNKFCSHKCYWKSLKGKKLSAAIRLKLSKLAKKRAIYTGENRNCLFCGEKFYTKPCHIKKGWGKYCSHNCYLSVLKSKSLEKKCCICQKTITVIFSNNKKKNYCSKKCYGIARSKMKISKETRKKMSDTQKIIQGAKRKIVKRICLECGKDFNSKPGIIRQGKGKFCSKQCDNKHRSGSNSRFWRGGIQFEPYGIEFNEALKEQIRNRDGRVCQLCGVPEIECLAKLSIHHIDYNKKNNSPSNLISLCNRCHLPTNNKTEYWTNYFKQNFQLTGGN